MRKLLGIGNRAGIGIRVGIGIGIAGGLLAAFPLSAAAQQATDTPVCRNVTGTADIDGTQQQISGLACQQPDGTWLIQQGDSNTFVYPVLNSSDYANYYYDYGPWYGWWPPVFVGASFVFVDRFHHFHPVHGVYYGRVGVRPVGGMHGGFHGGFHGGGMWGGGGGHHR